MNEDKTKLRDMFVDALFNEDKIRQQECETYLDNAIYRKSQHDKILDLQQAVSWLALELAGNGLLQNVKDPDTLRVIKSVPFLEETIQEIMPWPTTLK
jgi:hypothetical protein